MKFKPVENESGDFAGGFGTRLSEATNLIPPISAIGLGIQLVASLERDATGKNHRFHFRLVMGNLKLP